MGHLVIVKVLLAAGADITAENNVSVISPLIPYHTLHHIITKLMLLLLYSARRVLISAMYVKEGFTALHRASSIGHLDIVQVLLAAGADITAKDNVSVISPLIPYHTLHHIITKLMLLLLYSARRVLISAMYA